MSGLSAEDVARVRSLLAAGGLTSADSTALRALLADHARLVQAVRNVQGLSESTGMMQGMGGQWHRAIAWSDIEQALAESALARLQSPTQEER